ncbi:MAG: hypothetical protein RJB66_2687 [Pseudomonadota bacterium]|jgi:TolA-binding protein
MKRFQLSLLSLSVSTSLFAAEHTPKGVLPEIKLNKQTEAANVKTAAEAEALISRSEDMAIKQLEALLKKYKGSSQQPDLLFRLAELYTRRAKTGRFIDLYRSEKKLRDLFQSDLTSVSAKNYLGKAIENYQIIEAQHPQFAAMDEVLFNRAFAHDQRGERDLALQKFLMIPEKFPKSVLLPETNMALGELYFQKQNYATAMTHFDLVQKWPRTPIAPLALYKSAWCSYNQKETSDGLKKLEKLLLQSQKIATISHVRTEARRDLALFYSEVGTVENAITYFNKKLLPNEVGPTVLDLSAIYERHGKLLEMDSVLAQFLKDNPQDESAGPILIKRAHYHNDKQHTSTVVSIIQDASKLCNDPRWQSKSKDSEAFCKTSYPDFLTEYTSQWWQAWNKLNRSKDMISQLHFIFGEYLHFEKQKEPNIPLHLAYAEFLFSQGEFKAAGLQYEELSKNEKAENPILHTALYGHIVSLDRQLATDNKNQVLREKLSLALNEYLMRMPTGEFTQDVMFKKAYLFYEARDFSQSLITLSKMIPKTSVLINKRDDLILEIHRAKKDYPSLASASLIILKSSTGERALKIKGIYQEAQQSIIQQLVEKNKFGEAATLSELFYKEHRPEIKALDALHLAIELLEKRKQFRRAAEQSEVLAKEMAQIKKSTDAEKFSLHANELFLKLGDLNRARVSMSLALSLVQTPEKKRELNELLAEFSSWSGDVESTDQAWQALEQQMSASEKQVLLTKRLKFFGQYSPEKAKKLENTLIEKGVEPYFSKAELKRGEELCSKNKLSDCYQIALNLNKDTTPSDIRRQARYLQSKVLVSEYFKQGLKASSGRMAMVMSFKAEKFAKAAQLLETLGGKSDDLDIRKKALLDLKNLYADYTQALQTSADSFDTKNEDLMALKEEISQILPTLQNRPRDIEKALADLEQITKTTLVSQNNLQGSRSDLNGRELRIYVPSWEEAIAYRPLLDLTVGKKSCVLSNISRLNSLSALGREANACLSKGLYKELEVAALRLSDLFPDAPWGPYYLSVAAWQTNSLEQSVWYLKLAQQRAQEPLLSYEDLRTRFSQKPDASLLNDLKQMGDFWNQIEEQPFLATVDFLQQKKCEGATETMRRLKADYWKTTGIAKMVSEACPPPAPQTVTRADVPAN